MNTLLLTITIAGLATFSAAHAECRINDPTGTPLNARTLPNGPVLGRFHSDAVVEITDSVFDRGRAWVFVRDAYDKRSYGWVFRDYLDCR